MTDFKLLQQALDALEFPHDSEWSNKAKTIEALQHALAQPEFDTPESHIVKWSIPVDPNNFGEPLAQPKQEPVAWMMPDYGDVLSASEADGTGIYNIPLYTAPPKPEPKSISTNDHLCAMLRQVHDVLACTALPMKRKWVGLTSEELATIVVEHAGFPTKQAQAISDKLKEKNT